MPTLAWIYLGPKQLRPNTLWPENQIFKIVILHLPSEIKAIIINKLKKLSCKGKHHQFNLYKPMFSIKAHFLICNYQACKQQLQIGNSHGY